jgi:hypothetical protein
MKLNKSIVALTSLVAFAATPLFAGTGKTFKETVVVQEEESSWYNAALSTGYDSLYMYRGVNVLRTGGYGNGLWWTDANFTWNISDNDTLTVGGWQAFGLSSASYREFDAYLSYAHSFGDLSVGLGYTFYYIYPPGAQDFANELNAKIAYNIDLGFMTLTPAVAYYFELGPDYGPTDSVGAVNSGSSYLDIRLNGSIPVVKDVVSIDPYAAFGLNFDYNFEGPDFETFSGANNIEFGVAVPWKVNDIITVSGYIAYSYAFEGLTGYYGVTTQPSTFWGGGKVAFAF